MSMQFRFAKSDEYPAISEFLHTHWAKGHIYTRDEELFRWTFGRSNHWDDDGYSFALAEDNGELVGILGGIPFVFNAFGKKSKGVWIVNYVIRPDHRKGTGALQLLSMFRKAPFEATRRGRHHERINGDLSCAARPGAGPDSTVLHGVCPTAENVLCDC